LPSEVISGDFELGGTFSTVSSVTVNAPPIAARVAR
jgi:hypothetical protein